MEDIVQHFFITIEAKESTKEAYTYAIQMYQRQQGMTMDNLLTEAEEDMMNKVVPRRQRLINRLVEFNEYLGKGHSSNTKALYMTAVKSFYKTYGIPIPRIGKSKRKARIEIQNQWKGFTKDDISFFLKHCNIRDRAIIMLICSSGLSKKEIRDLKRSDFEGNQDKNNITTFKVRRSKTQFDYITFCTPETTKTIFEYLKTRDDDNEYLFVSRNKTKISVTGWNFIFRDLNQRVKIDRDDYQFSQTRSHNFRKYFQSALQNHSNLDIWKIDFMMAHETESVRAHYQNIDIKKLRDDYKKNMHILYIETTVEKIISESAQKEIQDLKEHYETQLDTLLKDYNDIKKQNQEIQKDFDDQIKKIEDRLTDQLKAILSEQGAKALDNMFI